MNEPAPIEIHKALADDTRYRLYRYLRLSGRPVPVRELATRLGLHANTIRPHLRRLVDAGLVASETRRGPSAVGRPQTVYTAVAMDNREGRDLPVARRHPRHTHQGTARTHGGGEPRSRMGRLPHDQTRPAARRAAPRTQPGRPSRRAGGGGLRSPVPPPWEQIGGDRAAELSVPGPARGAPRARLHGAPRTPRGHVGGIAPSTPPPLVRASRGSGFRLSSRRRRVTSTELGYR